jgi:hypothetical protein
LVPGQNVYYPGNNNVYSQPIKTYRCPSDPTAPANGVIPYTTGGTSYTMGACSYASNGLVFNRSGITFTNPPMPDGSGFSPQGSPAIPRTFQDGTSNTLLFTEKYAQCTNSTWPIGGNFWAYSALHSPALPPPMEPQPKPLYPGFEISFFAAQAGGATAIGPASKFQVQPVQTNCDPLRASSGHTAVINGLLADGSVRSISQSLSADTWWFVCTPSGGEVLGSDW